MKKFDDDHYKKWNKNYSHWEEDDIYYNDIYEHEEENEDDED